MTRDDLALSVDRHATSKLDDEDLLRIRTLGFRGEALPSIGAVSKLDITTRHATEPHAWALNVDAGAKSNVVPAALTSGTRVEVSDLFYATPARLKFLKTDRTEAEAVREVVRRLAMARARHRVFNGGRGARASDMGRGIAGCCGTPHAARRYIGRGLSRQRHRGAVRARRRQRRRLCRGTIADAGERIGAISVRQRTPGARQTYTRRCARGPMPTTCRATGIRSWRCS